MNLDDYPIVAVGTNKLKGRSHYTRDRFLSMVLRILRFHDRVIITANPRTEDLVTQIIGIFKDTGLVVEEDRNFMVKNIRGKDQKIIYWILDKIPSCRKD